MSPLSGFLGKLFPGMAGAGSSWWRGAVGERKVGRRLAALDKNEWMPLHDRPLGTTGRNVDHLLIGTGGVFSINTKNLRGNVVVKKNAFVVNGHAVKALHVARDEARRVSSRLSAELGSAVAVTPVIVVLTPSLVVRTQPDDVFVLALRDVPSWFASRARVLGLAEASRVYRISRQENTWTAPVEALRPQEPQGLARIEGLTVKAWKSWGHDRLYVNDAARNALGYLDRRTGEVRVVDPARREDVMMMLEGYLGTS